MKKWMVFFGLLVALSHLASAQVSMKKLIDENFKFAEKQYQVLMKNVPDSLMPRTYNFSENKNINSDTKWWCSGFYPGTLLYIYEQTHNPIIKKEAEKRLKILEPIQHYTGNHDLGFMMYCSYGNAYRLFKKPEYLPIIQQSAASLITRYRPTIKAIQSWNSSEKLKCPVIIDNMMNLELLCWATDKGGDKKFKEIAVTHSNTTLKNHFRPDYSSYHVVDYDLKTGNVLKKLTWQGYNDSSSWARGQAWGLYGYTLMYRFTKDKTYLKQAENIAKFLLKHTNLPADKIPYWDYDVPAGALRDASAAAIIASALLELGQYVTANKNWYLKNAETMLRTLASDKYRAKLGENGGFLLMHSVGSLPHNSEVDVPLTYADYYFLEALGRYKNWYLK